MKLRIAAIVFALLAGCRGQNHDIIPIEAFATGKAKDLLFDTSGTLIDEIWSVHRIGEAKIGYRWSRAFSDDEDGTTYIRRIVVDQLEIPRFGGIARQMLKTATLETPSGDVLHLEYELQSGGQKSRVQGQVIAGQLRLQRVNGSQRETLNLPWSDSVRGYYGIEDSFSRQPIQPGERREIAVILALTNQIQRYEMRAGDWEEAAAFAGPKRLLRVEVTPVGGTAMDERLTYWVDEQGTLYKEARSFLEQTTLRATELAAMSPNDTIDFDLGLHVRVPLAERLPGANAMRRARYRVTVPDGDPAALFAECDYQRVARLDTHTALIEVGLPAAGTASAAIAPPTRYDFEPNRWIESADKSIASLADTAAGTATDPREVAMAIREHVFRWLDKSESDQVLATARQAAEGRKGDCSEHAMLTAGACRARGIPARVAIGLIYDDASQSMVYHMWTEVWIDDAWLPIDATQPHPEFVAARLKLSDSNLYGTSDFGIVAPVIRVAGRLQIEPIQEREE